MGKRRVMVVDDSAFMRKILSDIINSHAELEVCGIAHDGREAVEKFEQFNPDIITMDVEMPEMDGLEALKQILKKRKLPVIMISAHSQEGSQKTLEAMGAGAVDFILKPSELTESQDELKNDLIAKLVHTKKIQVVKYERAAIRSQFFNPTRKKILVIGSSTGGPQTLEALLTEIPKNIPSPILIVQHMPAMFTKSLAERLNKICDIEIREAADGDSLKNGCAYIAPGDFHMELVPEFPGHEGTLRMNQKEKELGVRPCVNILLRSVAPIFKENTICIILTGMGTDGTEGSREVKKFNGTVIAQSESTSIIYGMPKSVVESNLADEVLDINKIAVAALQLLEI